MYLSVFSPNAGKYGPEITPYLGTSRSVGLELTDRPSQFPIDFDYFVEHFSLIFMKFVDYFLIAHCSVNTAIK